MTMQRGLRSHELTSSCIFLCFLTLTSLGLRGGAYAVEPAPLMREAVWADGTAETIFREDFADPGATELEMRPERPKALRSAERVGDGGHDSGPAYRIDLELPVGETQEFRFPVREADATGIQYRFYLKVDVQPEPAPGTLHLRINQADTSLHSIYHSRPLEEERVKSGEWMTETTTNFWRLHNEYLYEGWVQYEGDTANYPIRRPPLEKFDGIEFRLTNRHDQPLRVQVYLDDVKVIRRDVYDLPHFQAAMNAPRPILVHTRQQIQLATKRVASGMKLPRELAAYLRTADERVNQEVVVPHKQAGWPGVHYCERDDCEGKLDAAPPAGYRCRTCGRVHTGERYDALLVHRQHQLNSEATRALGFAWHWTGDERYARKAEEILHAYAEAIEGFSLGHNWLGDCWLMEDFLIGYDYIYESLSEPSRELIDQKFLKTMVGRIYHYNHVYPEGYIRLARICSWAALLTKDREWMQYLLFSGSGNREVIFRYGLTEDFVSLKGPGYHGDIIRGFNAWGASLENANVKFFDERMRGPYDVIAKQLLPDGSLPAFGHTNVGYSAAAYAPEVAYRYYRDPVYLAMTIQAFRDDESARLFWEDPKIPEEVEALSLPSTHLAALGVTLLRTAPDAALGLSWGAPQRNDPSRLDFHLHGKGGHLIWGSGTIGYGHPAYEKWYRQSVSRNVLVVDETTQTPKAGRTLFLDMDGPEQAIAAELADAYAGTRWLRTAILFEEGEALLVDVLSSPRERTVDWICQLPGQVTTDLDMTDAPSVFGSESGYDELSDVRGGDASKPFAVTLQHEGRGVRLRSAPAEEGRFYLATGRTGKLAEPSPVGLLRRERAKEAVFAVLFQPYADNPPQAGRVELLSSASDAVRVSVQTSERTYEVTIARDGANRHDEKETFDVKIRRQ
jgi:hypothetical protein